MSVFETAADYGSISYLINWICDEVDDEEGALAYAVRSLLPALDEDEDCDPALRSAWKSKDGAMKTAALLRLALLEGWHEEETDRDELDALASWARQTAIRIRRCLLEPAMPEQIADNLVTLCEVLGQDIGERTAEFIIEMISQARLPVYLLGAVCERIAKHEGGKLRPASFTRLLQTIEPRLKQARRVATDARLFVENLESALVLLKEGTRPNQGGPARRTGLNFIEAPRLK